MSARWEMLFDGGITTFPASGFGVMRSKYEYEDLVRIAREQNMTLYAVRDWLEENA